MTEYADKSTGLHWYGLLTICKIYYFYLCENCDIAFFKKKSNTSPQKKKRQKFKFSSETFIQFFLLLSKIFLKRRKQTFQNQLWNWKNQQKEGGQLFVAYPHLVVEMLLKLQVLGSFRQAAFDICGCDGKLRFNQCDQKKIAKCL